MPTVASRPSFDVIVLVGPSHFVRFEGVSVYLPVASRRRLGWRRSIEPCRNGNHASHCVSSATIPPRTRASTRSRCSCRSFGCVAPSTDRAPGDGSHHRRCHASSGTLWRTALSGRRALPRREQRLVSLLTMRRRRAAGSDRDRLRCRFRRGRPPGAHSTVGPNTPAAAGQPSR